MAGNVRAQKRALQNEKLYKPKTAVVSNKNEVEKALEEYKILQEGTVGSHYMDWCRQNVNYKDIEDDDSIENLRRANDSYTMSMLTNCLAPIRSGVTISSLVQVWVSYKTMSIVNPNFEQDIGVLYTNMRESISKSHENMKKSNPVMAEAMKGMFRQMDNYLETESRKHVSSSMSKALESGSVDSMVMSPKQVAALKVSFMEQYYADLRSVNGDTRNLDAGYDNAVKHLSIIARNNGFDMNVVAAEERRIVGLKIIKDSRYANIFEETSSGAMFGGVEPVRDDADGKLFSGKFMTGDEHEFTNSSSSTGAFTVRKPYHNCDVDSKRRYEDRDVEGCLVSKVQDQTRCFVYARAWVDDLDKYGIDDKQKAKILAELSDMESTYKKSVANQLVDDGVRRTKREALAWVNDEFNAKTKKVTEEIQSNGESREYASCFDMEVSRTIDKRLLLDAGFGPYVKSKDHMDKILTNIENTRRIKMKEKMGGRLTDEERAVVDWTNRELAPLSQYESKRAAMTGNDNPNYFGFDIVDAMHKNYLQSMSTDEAIQVIKHAAANRTQGMSNSNMTDENAGRNNLVIPDPRYAVAKKDHDEIMKKSMQDAKGDKVSRINFMNVENINEQDEACADTGLNR